MKLINQFFQVDDKYYDILNEHHWSLCAGRPQTGTFVVGSRSTSLLKAVAILSGKYVEGLLVKSFDKNVFNCQESNIKIDGMKLGEFTYPIDDKYLSFAFSFIWYRDSNGYFKRKDGNNKVVILHREIAKMEGWDIVGKQIDHINGNPSDNRVCNLDVVTDAQNKGNMPKPCHNTSGVVGVSLNKNKHRRKWTAAISINDKRVFIGNYETIEEAAEAYKQKHLETHKNYSSFVKRG